MEAYRYHYIFFLYGTNKSGEISAEELMELLARNKVSFQEIFFKMLRNDLKVPAGFLDDPESTFGFFLPRFISSRLYSTRKETLFEIFENILLIDWIQREQKQLSFYYERSFKYDHIFSCLFFPTHGSTDIHINCVGRWRKNRELKDKLIKEVFESVSTPEHTKYGKQEDNDDLQTLYQDFLLYLRGSEAIIERAGMHIFQFTSKPVSYYDWTDVLSLGPPEVNIFGYYNRQKKVNPKFLDELNQLFEDNNGFKRHFLELLLKKNRQIEVGRAFNEVSFDFECSVPISIAKYLFRVGVCYGEFLLETFSKLLAIEWLEEDAKSLRTYIDLHQGYYKEIPSVDSLIVCDGRIFAIKPTKPDGTCGLHALLGQFLDGMYSYPGPRDAREVFIEKIKEKVEDNTIKKKIKEILIGHLNAVEDPSSKLLLDGEEGERIRNGFVALRQRFANSLKERKSQEAELWALDIETIQEQLIEEAKKSQAYAELDDDAIIAKLREAHTKLLDVIYPEKTSFLEKVPLNRKREILTKLREQIEIATEWSRQEFNYIFEHLYPLYLETLAKPEFYLNTQEVSLAALLFNKKAQIVHLEGEALTDVIHPELPGEPVIIYHHGLHFSRATPCTEEEIDSLPTQEEIRKTRSNSEKDKKSYQKAIKSARELRAKELYAMQRYRSSIKEEAAQLIVAASWSAFTINPTPIALQCTRSSFNLVGGFFDPLNESKLIKGSKLIGNSGFSKYFGGSPYHVVMALVVDLCVLKSEKEGMNKLQTAGRNFSIGAVKGVLSFDQKKLLEYSLGSLFSEVTRNCAPEEKPDNNFETRLLRSLLTSSDIQNHILDGWIDKALVKKDEKPKVEEVSDPEEEQEASKPSEEQLQYEKDKAAYEKWLAGQSQEVKDIIAAQKLLEQKEKKLETAEEDLGKAIEAYNKAQGLFNSAKKERKAMFQAVDDQKTATTELQNAQKALHDLLDKTTVDTSIFMPEPIDPKNADPFPGLRIRQEQVHIYNQFQEWDASVLNKHNAGEHFAGAGIYFTVVKYWRNDYRVHRHHGENKPQACGRFLSENAAEAYAKSCADYIRQNNMQNYRREGINSLRGHLGMEGGRSKPFVPLYVEVSAHGDKNNVYVDGKKHSSHSTPAKAILKAQSLMDSDIIAKSNANRSSKTKVASSLDPNYVPPPNTRVPEVHVRRTKDNYHLSMVDNDGNRVNLGKYSSSEEADLIRQSTIRFNVETLAQESQCGSYEKQLLSAGIKKGALPQRPSFEKPNYSGKDSSNNYQAIISATVRNRQKMESYKTECEKLSSQPLQSTGVSQAEINQLVSQAAPALPPIEKTNQFIQSLSKGLHWLGKHVSGEMTIGTVPLYQTKTPERVPSYTPEYRTQPTPVQSPSVSQWTWQDMQNLQNQKIFEMNMSYQSPQPSPEPSQSGFSKFFSGVASYLSSKGPLPTTSPSPIAPPTQLTLLQKDQPRVEGPLPAFNPELQKKYPEAYALALQIDTFGQQKIALLRFTLDQHQAAHHLQQSAPFIAGLLGHSPHPEIPGLEPITLKVEAFAIASGHFLKDLAIQNLNHPLQSRIDMLISVPRGAGHLLHQGLQLLLSGSDPISQDLAAHLNQVAAHLDRLYVEKFQRHNPSYDPNSSSSSVGKFMGEMLLLEGGALALRGATLERLTLKQVQQMAKAPLSNTHKQILGALQEQSYRSGLVTEKMALKLSERSIRKIEPIRLPSVRPGPELEWLSENASKIRQLQSFKGKDFDRFIKSTFKDQNLTELQIRRLINYSGFKTYPKPFGLPSDVVVEFAKKNGGMVYRKLGTTESQNQVVRVCPGLAKESLVSSKIKGHIEHGTLRQQYPYVVQRKGAYYLTNDGIWIKNGKDARTHMPLETYEFKGWE